ncbi:MAG: hypothetical protein PHN49_02075 [Candidatus Omnitrophica bacterium]|nr:hypothetical protein [Candidatus Omnitrophota bacterium]MDD5670406.1 hypothetical protein [Candidatus Omnitrophota bacterium]
MSNRIVLIGHCFGKVPNWFDICLKTCEWNRNVDWLFFTDCLPERKTGENIRFVKISIADLKELIKAKTGTEPQIPDGFKVCDFRPAFGHVFEAYLQGRDFWGHCDFDIIWGDIRRFITDEMLDTFDVISSYPHTVVGSCTLYRNVPLISTLYRQNPYYREAFQAPWGCCFDELGQTMRHGYGFGKTVREFERAGKIKGFYQRLVGTDNCDDRDEKWIRQIEETYGEKTQRDPDFVWGPCVWQNGRLFFAGNRREIMSFHFKEYSVRHELFAPLPLRWRDDIVSFEVNESGFIFHHSTWPGQVAGFWERGASLFVRWMRQWIHALCGSNRGNAQRGHR